MRTAYQYSCCASRRGVGAINAVSALQADLTLQTAEVFGLVDGVFCCVPQGPR